MTEEQASGIKKVINLGGGLNTGTKTQISETSWSGLENWDSDGEDIVTRRGMTRYNSTPFYPGCVQFGYSDTQRVHYLRARDGDFGPQQPGTTQQSKWGVWFYAKELVSTTAPRTLVTLATGTTSYIEIGWDTSNRLACRLRPTQSQAFQVVNEGAGGETVSRTSTTAYLYGATFISDAPAGTVEVTLWNSYGARVTTSKTFSSAAWDTCTDLILGNDINVTYPDTDWTNTENRALYGYMSEVLLVRNRPYDIVKYFTDMKTAPGQRVLDADRVAHYKLQNSYEDAFGLNPALASAAFRTGGGLSNYSVEDAIISGSRDLLHNTKSWEVDTFGVNSHIYGQTTSLSSRYRSYLNAVGTTYTLTFDILPVRTATGTFTLLEATTAGPYIKILKKTTGKTQIQYGHKFNASNNPTVTHNILNNYASKISCQYGHSSKVATTISLRIFQDTMLVASTLSTLVSSTTPTVVGNVRLGTSNVTSISSNFFTSGLILHDLRAGDTWGDKPQETYENVTTYTTVTKRKRRKGRVGGFFGQLSDKLHSLLGMSDKRYKVYDVQVPTGTKAERRGDSEPTFAVFDLPYFANVKGAWLFNEYTGYDTASGSTPHGVITNVFSTSTTDGSDFIIKNNSTPIFKLDRNDAGLITSGYLESKFKNDADNLLAYNPVNTNLQSRIFITDNAYLSDTNGNKFKLGDTYQYSNRLSGKTRGFMYGNSLYFHNDDYYLRFNGNEIRPIEIITPTIQLSLSKTNGSSGLNGAYKYSYTYVDASGIESYPTIPTSITVKLGSISVSLNPKIASQAFLTEQIQAVNIYRNKGGTSETASADLANDADKSLYLLKSVPMRAIAKAPTAVVFKDTTADSALGGNPPEVDTVDPLPPCKYSAVFQDTVILTGHTKAPNHYFQSAGQSPELMGIPGYEEFLTEDGDHNTGIAACGSGFIVFKQNARRFVRGGLGGETYEYHNGGCMSHDSLITIGNQVVGLGSNGFFITDGHSYKDLNTVDASSIQEDVDSWSSTVKEAADAVYHQPTRRYMCYVNSKYYVFSFVDRTWTTYTDVVGIPFVYNNDMYMFKKGFLYKESTSQGYVGTTIFKHSVNSGTVGKIQVVSTTSPPTTNPYGLPAYVGTTHYWVTAVSQTATTNDIYLDTTKDFSNATKMSIGGINCKASSKFFDMRTPTRNKIYKNLLVKHGNTEDGVVKIRLARNEGAFDDAYDHYTVDTDVDKVQTVLRVRSENMAVRFAVEDGKSHRLKSYEIVYDQESIL